MSAPDRAWFDAEACRTHKHHATKAAAERNAHGARYKFSRAFHVIRCPDCRAGWIVAGVADWPRPRRRDRS